MTYSRVLSMTMTYVDARKLMGTPPIRFSPVLDGTLETEAQEAWRFV